MKKVLIAAAALMISLAVRADDGNFNFINVSSAGGVNARVTYGVGSPAALLGTTVPTASGLVAQLYVKNAGGSYTGLLPVAGFKTGTGAGVWDLKTVIVPNASANMTFKVDVFDSTATSYATATTFHGSSGDFTGSPGIAPNGPAFLTGLAPFTVIPVPEPTTIALGVLGAAALLIRRKK